MGAMIGSFIRFPIAIGPAMTSSALFFLEKVRQTK
jgi:hypothetical protein